MCPNSVGFSASSSACSPRQANSIYVAHFRAYWQDQVAVISIEGTRSLRQSAAELKRQAVHGDSMICLIGPGGAGKSTAGAVLAHCLAFPFLDLDQQFATQHGDIDQFIISHGHQAYARANVEMSCIIVSAEPDGVFALSSGFMTYPPTIHQRYAELWREIARSPTTFVLLPSLDLETCVVETVRRQLLRPSGRRGTVREEASIRARPVTSSPRVP